MSSVYLVVYSQTPCYQDIFFSHNVSLLLFIVSITQLHQSVLPVSLCGPFFFVLLYLLRLPYYYSIGCDVFFTCAIQINVLT